MSKFKVGDRVKAYGRFGKVLEINSLGIIIECKKKSNGAQIARYPQKWVVWPDERQVELANARHELHVTCTDGITTTAAYKLDGKVEKTAKAVCCPSDTFNFNVGAELAIKRVLGVEDRPAQPAQPAPAPKQDEPRFKVGDRVTGKVAGWAKGVTGTVIDADQVGMVVSFEKVVSPSFGRGEHKFCAYQSDYEVEPCTEPEPEPKSKYEGMSNKELKIRLCAGHHCFASLGRYQDCPLGPACVRHVTNENRDEVIKYLINEDLAKRPKYYSGKVVCVWAEPDGEYFTAGGVYEYQEGYVKSNGSGCYNSGDPAKTKAQALNRAFVKFIEYKGEANGTT